VFITSDIQKNIMFTCIPLEISSMVENLLKNAFEAVLADGKERHVVSIHAEKDHVITIQINDNGVGLELGAKCAQESALEADCFRPGKTTKKGGSGIGMVTVMDVIKKYNGNLLIEGKRGEGTTVTVILNPS
jgi:two-component system sensor histidine kinase HydH